MKRILIAVSVLLLLCISGLYLSLSLSLPSLNDDRVAPVSAKTSVHRDAKGHTHVESASRVDAAYATGFAHAQDRLFQMDLFRRSGAGEIAELFGEAAIEMDKRARFHQFRQRAHSVLSSLPQDQLAVLNAYAQGVNDAAAQYTLLPFEYLLLGAQFKPWLPEDSLLVVYSMYLDLQGSQVERDITFSRVAARYGQSMVDFMLLPSSYQAALDYTDVEPPVVIDIPPLPTNDNKDWAAIPIPEPIDIGSNNWAISGALTSSGVPMLSDDMHLGLRVPPIWYRLSLSYTQDDQNVSIHGVSLPGAPGIIVGSNMHVAWGFTNANLDNTDWVKLTDDTPTNTVKELIHTPDGQHELAIEISEYGPVRTIAGQRYALQWVAHYPYAINLKHLDLDAVKTIHEARDIASSTGIPVQNFVAVDAEGNIGWMPAGAVTARQTPTNTAINQEDVSDLWPQREPNLPAVINPEHQRIWTANARVIGVDDLARYGDGGYAVGARGMQIRDRLFEKEQYSEEDFYLIQQDNDAQFLSSWQALLVNTLRQSPNEFETDLKLLDQWQACACSSSVGYTLTRKFRSALLDRLFAPIEQHLQTEGMSLRPVLRHLEPALNALLEQQPPQWLPSGYQDYLPFLLDTYRQTRQSLLDEYANGQIEHIDKLTWGNVNELNIQHPFSRVMPILSRFLDMPSVPGYGDSYLPAVQNGTHGASQRLTVQPGRENEAILTIPGGQSGHPLSEFYRVGFSDYMDGEKTPLLPSAPIYTISFEPQA
ncbi:penicillin acylase family protein [Alteromonas facilis]|uniref:penicillin acylase family protein n=1 Tax=Alteromonas facilis TaxID=2048004 RepID=UPI000C286F2C|nr:penicillin acylase family protein [Alteromonas facilis]